MSIAGQWEQTFSIKITDLIWRGYELLQAEMLSRIDRNQDDLLLEESISAELQPRIGRLLGDEPFYVQLESPEWLSLKPGTTKPPKYDLAFVLWANSNAKWPMEAKVLRTDGAVSEYVRDLREEFLTCRYAPASSGGAMLGYLLSGAPTTAFSNIARSAGCSLDDVPDCGGRSHKTSSHTRIVPPEKGAPALFRCHHILLPI
jgi:hypothetical protein